MARLTREEREQMYHAEKSHVALPNMLYKDDAPQFIAIIGPPRTGKTALLRAVATAFARGAPATRGPLTVCSRTKRMTLYEAANSLEDTIDAIKVADAVILTVSATRGLEKETLEALGMVAAHSAAKVVVVFTRAENDTQPPRKTRTARERITRAIEREHGDVARFLDTAEDGIAKIARVLDLLKTRPQAWKGAHPHVVVDWAAGGAFHGYVRGGPLRDGAAVHVPGHGDFVLSGLTALDDPCALRARGPRFYAPAASSAVPAADSSAAAVALDFGGEDVPLFADGRACAPYEPVAEESCADEAPAFAEMLDEQTAADTSTAQAVAEKPVEDTTQARIAKLRGRFARTGTTEEEHIAHFNATQAPESGAADAPGTPALNFLQQAKMAAAARKLAAESVTEALLPGTYCRFSLPLPPAAADGLLIAGAVLPGESQLTLLKGRAIKNKWQKKDIKSGVPLFLSVGWWRYQTLPVFAADGRALKYLRAATGARACDALFRGPAVAAKTGFFIFSPAAGFRLQAAGHVTDASGGAVVKKKLKLVGYPVRVLGNNAVIQSMFTSDREVDRFVSARLRCASGLRGVVKMPVGTGGHFRGTFEGPMLMSDVVFLRCFVPLDVPTLVVPMRAGARYVRSPWELRQEAAAAGGGASDEEASSSEESDSVPFAPRRDRDFNRTTRQAIARLERALPFDPARVRTVVADIALPVPPEKRGTAALQAQISAARAARDAAAAAAAEQAREAAAAQCKAAAAQKAVHRKILAVEGKRAKDMGRKQR